MSQILDAELVVKKRAGGGADVFINGTEIKCVSKIVIEPGLTTVRIEVPTELVFVDTRTDVAVLSADDGRSG